MPYTEAPASGPSARFVQAFWQSTGPVAPGAAQRVLPDGCTDIIIDLARPTRATRYCAEMVGTMTRAIVIPLQDQIDLFGIRFRPGAAPLLWCLPMPELCDGRVAFVELVRGSEELTERLATVVSFADRVACASTWLEERIVAADVEDDKLRTLAAINAHLEARRDIDALTASTGWNARKLQRFFDATYGTTAATMRCFWRFEAVRRGLVQIPSRSLSALAFDHGYADRAHMAREFQRFAGLTISAWRAESALS